MFLNEIKKADGILTKFWYPSWDVCVYEVGLEVAVASLFLSSKNSGHDPGVGWLSSSPGDWLAGAYLSE